LHHTYAAALSIKESKGAGKPGQEYQEVAYVEGLENPTEGSFNIVRWLVKNRYSDEEIEKVMGGNALRVMADAWA
jgi:membrane dipeptidase